MRVVAEHEFDARCTCGAEWRLVLDVADEELDDAMATCLACGADTFDLSDLGERRLRDP